MTLCWKLRNCLREDVISTHVFRVGMLGREPLMICGHMFTKLKCCPCLRYEGIYESSTVVPLDLNLNLGGNEWTTSYSGRFILEKEPSYALITD